MVNDLLEAQVVRTSPLQRQMEAVDVSHGAARDLGPGGMLSTTGGTALPRRLTFRRFPLLRRRASTGPSPCPLHRRRVTDNLTEHASAPWPSRCAVEARRR